MANDTIVKFGFPATLVCEYENWVVLLRPAQVTLGSLVLAAKGEATAFGQLSPTAHAELALVTKDIETTLIAETGYQKSNYLMLMMVDPHVHFHVIPRYEGSRTLEDISIPDVGWPGLPDLKAAIALEPGDFERLRDRISRNWLRHC